MTKQELTDLIALANRVEEEMVASVSNHLQATVEWFKGTSKEADELRAGLEKLEKDSIRHTRYLAALSKYVAAKDKDVY